MLRVKGSGRAWVAWVVLLWLMAVPVTLLVTFDPPEAAGISEDDGSALLQTADLDDKLLAPLPSRVYGVRLPVEGVASAPRDGEAPSVSVLATASRSPPRR